MKIFNFLVAFFSFLGLSTAQGSNMPVVACTPTGAGVCNLGVAGLVTGNSGRSISVNLLVIISSRASHP